MICAVQVCLGGVSLNKEKEMKKAVFLAVLAFATTSVFGEMDDAEVSEGSQNERIVGKVSKKKNGRSKNKNSTKGKSGKKADIYKDFPLHKAVNEGNEEWINQNISDYSEDDINAKAKDGRTPLMLAAVKGNASVAKILIDNGANIEIKSDKGTPVLIFAALNNRFEMVKYLIEVQGMNPNIVDNSGFTALMTAANKGYEDIVEYLLQFEEVRNDINHKSKRGSTAYSLAKKKGYTEIMTMLENTGADVNVEVSSSTRSEMSEDGTDANKLSSNSKKRKRSSKNKSKSKRRKK